MSDAVSERASERGERGRRVRREQQTATCLPPLPLPAQHHASTACEWRKEEEGGARAGVHVLYVCVPVLACLVWLGREGGREGGIGGPMEGTLVALRLCACIYHSQAHAKHYPYTHGHRHQQPLRASCQAPPPQLAGSPAAAHEQEASKRKKPISSYYTHLLY